MGKGYAVAQLMKEFDAVCLAGGSRTPRDLNIGGRGLRGSILPWNILLNRINGLRPSSFSDALLDAKGKRVLVIGGGDTGADCVGIAHRQGAHVYADGDFSLNRRAVAPKDFLGQGILYS